MASEKSLFSRLKSGEKITVCMPDKEPFEIEWGPRGADAHLVRRVGDTSTRDAMTEEQCYTWLAKEEERGLVEVAKKLVSKQTRTERAAKKPKR